jgi:glycosyltransferase involved in cell wall biosynthesis
MFVLGLAPTKIGGMEKFLQSLSLALDKAGWDCVFCFDGEISPDFRRYISHPGVSLETVNSQGNLGFRAAFDLIRLLKQYRPTVFLYAFHGVMRCFPWLAKLYGCKRIFFNDHSSRDPNFVPGKMSFLKRLVGRTLTYPLDGIISVSEFTQKTGASLGLTAVPGIVIHNGVELRERDGDRRSQFRSRFHISQDAILITQVSWMVPVKGIDSALRTAQTLLASHPDAHFAFVGDGSYLEQYKELARELGIAGSVTFTGRISNPTDEGVFDATDIYFQPSVWQEASGLAILESMSVGSPVVVSRIGGLPEIVRDGETGFLSTVGDIDDYSSKIGRLLADKELRLRFGAAARNAVQENHQLQHTAAKYVTALS